MTSHLDSHTTTDVKPEMIPGVQIGNGIPHDKYNICGIAHCPCAHKQKRQLRPKGDQYSGEGPLGDQGLI